ncbi:alternative ribosome rescue aminoacyl-tRNA hydrolase ArfB [soil metagenome]
MAGSMELAPGVSVPEDAVSFAYSRAGGPGGQNVNKVSTRCELRVRLDALPMHAAARARLAALAGRRLLDTGELQLVSQSERSQAGNRDECFARLRELIVQAQVIPKPRRATKPTRGSKERRLREKKSRSDVKRKRGGGED